MKKLSVLLCLAAFWLAPGLALAQAPQPPATVPLPAGTNAWKMIFNDEFDSTAYNKNKWTPRADWGGINSFNGGREKYYESQIQVKNGVCHLVAQPDTTSPTFSGSYKSGEILSCRENSSSPYKFTFLYGYIEARMKTVNIPGFFGDFWMLPAKTNYTYEWEADILEQLGHDYRTMYQTYHYYPGLALNQTRNTSWATLNNPGLNGNGPVINFSTAYHTFGMDWQTNRLAYYIDGTESGNFPDTGANHVNVPRTAGYIIIQQMVENTWIQGTGILVPNPRTISETLYVDYVRVWQAVYDSTVGIRPGPADPEYLPAFSYGQTVVPNPATLQDIRDLGDRARVFTLNGSKVQPAQLQRKGIYFIGLKEQNGLQKIFITD